MHLEAFYVLTNNVPSTALLYSVTGANPFSYKTCQYLLKSYLFRGLKSNKKFSMAEITSLSLKNYLLCTKWYVYSSNFLIEFAAYLSSTLAISSWYFLKLSEVDISYLLMASRKYWS